MTRIAYNDCQYSDQDDDEERGEEYPCHHPKNWEGSCALDNKKDGRRDTCPLIE